MACQHSADLTMTEFFFLTFNNFPGIITSNAHDDASPRKLERSRAQPVVADSPGRAPGSCSPPRKAARHRWPEASVTFCPYPVLLKKSSRSSHTSGALSIFGQCPLSGKVATLAPDIWLAGRSA